MEEQLDTTELAPEITFDARPTVLKMTSLSATQLYNEIKNNGFPQPYQIGKRRIVWNRAQVLAWLESRPRGIRTSKGE